MNQPRKLSFWFSTCLGWEKKNLSKTATPMQEHRPVSTAVQGPPNVQHFTGRIVLHWCPMGKSLWFASPEMPSRALTSTALQNGKRRRRGVPNSNYNIRHMYSYVHLRHDFAKYMFYLSPCFFFISTHVYIYILWTERCVLFWSFFSAFPGDIVHTASGFVGFFLPFLEKRCHDIRWQWGGKLNLGIFWPIS